MFRNSENATVKRVENIDEKAVEYHAIQIKIILNIFIVFIFKKFFRESD